MQSFAFWGGLDISCGCFGPCQSSQVGIKSLMFVGTLFILTMLRFIGLLFYRNNLRV
ncbi:MAG: hypothetical protein LBE18_06600 [Planctomycetaceae bacterium]|nr:hypothetical protein [Planctomycetaceae bacterium]